MNRLPLIVISGYLGAGKTTLINRLLAEEHRLKLLVMVNDFGAINIDAELLASRDEDTLTLTNGCVCCTMGSDLFMALGDALDRRPRPDALIIEASGIAEPRRIANAAIAEPEMDYGGIVTVVDGLVFPALSDDALIGPQIQGQVREADLVVVSKIDNVPSELSTRLSALTQADILCPTPKQPLWPLLFGRQGEATPKQCPTPPGHPDYVGWSYSGDRALSREELARQLESRPNGLFRIKGLVRDPEAGAWEVQVVGSHVTLSASKATAKTQLVAIGLKSRVNRADIDVWWRNVPGAT